MAEDVPHENLIKELAEQFEPIFTNSPQGVYLYLDNTHKICNQKFADMLGYKSIDDWATNKAPVGYAVEEDQRKIADAYIDASDTYKAREVNVAILRQDGKRINVLVHLTPFTYRGEVFVLHFVSPT